MTLMELVQAKVPARFLGAEIRNVTYSRVGDCLDVDVIGLAEPVRVSGMEAVQNGVTLQSLANLRVAR